MLVLWQDDNATTIEKNCMGLSQVSSLEGDATPLIPFFSRFYPQIYPGIFLKDDVIYNRITITGKRNLDGKWYRIFIIIFTFHEFF